MLMEDVRIETIQRTGITFNTVASERIIALAKPVQRPTGRETDLREDAFTVSPMALKARCSKRLKSLAKPKIYPQPKFKRLRTALKRWGDRWAWQSCICASEICVNSQALFRECEVTLVKISRYLSWFLCNVRTIKRNFANDNGNRMKS